MADRAPAGAAWLLAGLTFAQAWPAADPPAPCAMGRERSADPARPWTAVAACAATSASPDPALRGPARRLFGLPVDLNRADAGTLETLPGIGPARAQALLDARHRAPFCQPADLERVAGIGPKTRAGIEPLTRIGVHPGCGDTPPARPPERAPDL